MCQGKAILLIIVALEIICNVNNSWLKTSKNLTKSRLSTTTRHAIDMIIKKIKFKGFGTLIMMLTYHDLNFSLKNSSSENNKNV